MPGSPYLEEAPPGLWSWPRLMPVLIGIFILECVAGAWIWTSQPEWRWMVYLILGIDFVVILAVGWFSQKRPASP